MIVDGVVNSSGKITGGSIEVNDYLLGVVNHNGNSILLSMVKTESSNGKKDGGRK